MFGLGLGRLDGSGDDVAVGVRRLLGRLGAAGEAGKKGQKGQADHLFSPETYAGSIAGHVSGSKGGGRRDPDPLMES